MAKLPFIDFKEVYSLADIEDLARMLNLPLKGAATLRCECPVHGGGDRALCVTPGVRAENGSLGVYKCWASGEKGGDRIGLVAHCMESTQQEAAHTIKDRFGGGTVPDRATVSHRVTVPDRDNVPPTPRQEREAPSHQFDPEKFASKLVWHEEIAKLGLTEDDAERLRVGFHPQQKHVFFPIANPDGSISAFIGVKDGKVKMPPQWLAGGRTVVRLKRA